MRRNSSSRNISQARGYSLGCLPQGPVTWKWILVTAVSYMCIEALLVTMRFLRTQTGNCRILSDRNCNGLLPLEALALGRPEKALWWLLSQFLRYFFCGSCGNELEGLALVAWGQKSLFPHWPTLHNLFCYHIYCDRRDILVVVHPFMTHRFYCGQDCTQECV